MGTRKSMNRQEDVPMARTIAPSPLKLSTNALYIASITAFAVSALALSLGISYIACALPLPMGIFQPVCNDDHYKYVFPLLIPTTAWFVIANWVGWEYFRNA